MRLPSRPQSAIDALCAPPDWQCRHISRPVPLLLTLHVSPLRPDGFLPVVCTDMGGNEVAWCATAPGKSLGGLRAELAGELQKRVSLIELILLNGHILPAAQDHLPLAEVLTCNAGQAAACEECDLI